MKQYQNENDSRRLAFIDCSDRQDQPQQGLQYNLQQQDHSQQSRPEKQSQSFDPIDKSREFFRVIMGKGRNRNRNRNKYTNNKEQSKDQYESNSIKEQPKLLSPLLLHHNNPQIDNKICDTLSNNNYNNNDKTNIKNNSNNINYNRNKKNYTDRKIKFSDRITKFKNRTNSKKYDVVEAAAAAAAAASTSTAAATLVAKNYFDVDDGNPIKIKRYRACVDDGNGNTNNGTGNDNNNIFENRFHRTFNENDHYYHHHNNDNDGGNNIDDKSSDDHDVHYTNNVEFECTNSNKGSFLSHPGNITEEYSYNDKNDKFSGDLYFKNHTNIHNNDHDVVVADDADAADQDHHQLQHHQHHREESRDFSDQNSIQSNTRISVSVVNDEDIGEISELTECDRDCYLNIEMGQPISKTNTPKNYELSKNIVIPTITISDHSHDINNTEGDEVFFDSTSNFDNENLTRKSMPENIINIKSNNNKNNNNEDNNNGNNFEEFVLSESDEKILNEKSNVNDNNQEGCSLIIQSDLMADCGIDKNIIISENLNESLPTPNLLDKQTDSPDSGIESVTQILLINTNDDDPENQLHINHDSELFLRDSSTDCDENYLQSDFDIQIQAQGHEEGLLGEQEEDQEDTIRQHRHIIIDSISLPDVVVESTTIMGNNSTKSDGNDDKNAIIITDNNDNDTRDLLNQEARYSAQLEDAQKLVYNAQAKVTELQEQIDRLEKEISIKSWNVDQLQAELRAAYKEDECVRKRLKVLEEELILTKQKLSESEEDANRRYAELETEHTELLEKFQNIQSLASALQTQLAFAQSDTEQCRLEKEKLREEKDAEIALLQKAIEKSNQERKEQEKKWQKEFEVLRNQNADQEEHLMTDCEWRLRGMQKTCKEKVEAAEKAKREALEKATEIEENAGKQLEEVKFLKSYQAEVVQLRGLTNDQRESLLNMTDQLSDMRSDLEAANKQLEEEIANVKKIRMQCDNALNDKDREMVQKIEEARGEVASIWESKLLEEMTRLTNELESVHLEGKQDALNKLQVEHLEEIKALTNRYGANEKELRKEIKMLRDKLQTKAKEFEDLQTKTDNALVKTRMHLEKADRDYQNALDREALKREKMAESLREEFEKEKLEMEEKFRIRLGHVKDEFAKEIANATEELAIRHKKDLEQQWEQLINEKEEALQLMESRHRIRLDEAEHRLKDLKIDHQRDLKDLKTNYEIERTTLESRDLQNTHEIEQLHRKCRCLTNLFEEMRMRYERRDPRPEDLREIAELRSRCESQERDLHLLTERLREIQMENEEQRSIQPPPRKNKSIRKPPAKTIPTSCDVIYEENEEGESPPMETPINGILANKSENTLTPPTELSETAAAES